MVPSEAFASHAGDTWIDRVLTAMGTLGVGLLMPSSVYSCVHAHLPQVQWAGRRWATLSYTLKDRDVCVLSRLRTEAAVQSLTDLANDLLHARLPCHEPGHWAVQLQDYHEAHLHLPNMGVGPTMLDHVWLTGLQAVLQSRPPGPPTHCLLHPMWHKKATKRMRQSAAGDAYVVGGYSDDDWNPDCPGLSMPFVPPASPMFLLGDVFDGHQQQDNPGSVLLLTPHAEGGLDPPPLWVVHGEPAFDRACKAVWGRAEWAILFLVPVGPTPDAHASPALEVVRLDTVPYDAHVAVTSLRESGAVEQGTVVVYQLHRYMTVWGPEYTTALDAIRSIWGCGLQRQPHGIHRPNVVLSPELTASNAALLGRVVVNPHSDVAWLEPARCLWQRRSRRPMPLPKKTGSPMWPWRATAVPRGQVPSVERFPRRRLSGQPLTYCTRLLQASWCMWWMLPSLGPICAQLRRPCTAAPRDQSPTSSTNTL